MKISSLFTAYNTQLSTTPNSTAVFTEAGMTTDSAQLKFGFFPLGSGILTDKSEINEAEISEGGTMVLGHDFGTVSYVKDKCKDERENNSRTIQNLQGIDLNIEQTFFTNFYLGLRDDTLHQKMKMTNLVVKRTNNYKQFCHTFFLTQLNLINPTLVICLGKEVGRILPRIFKTLMEPGKSLMSLYADEAATEYIVNTDDKIYGKRKFILIPHPSYAHINWRENNIKEKIRAAVKNEIFKIEQINHQIIPLIWNGYCPESWLMGKTIRMRLNDMDFFESEETGLQICVLRGVQAIILNFRGKGKFVLLLRLGDPRSKFNFCLIEKRMLEPNLFS
jgi:hypothetical protein